MSNTDLIGYVVIGTRENVAQKFIGGDFEVSYTKEIVNIFLDKGKAEQFIIDNKLKKPKKQTFAGTQYYKTGHYELELEEHSITR